MRKLVYDLYAGTVKIGTVSTWKEAKEWNTSPICTYKESLVEIDDHPETEKEKAERTTRREKRLAVLRAKKASI